MIGYEFLVLICGILCMIDPALSIRCHQCVNVKTETSDFLLGQVPDPPSSEVNPSCSSLGYSVDEVSCPNFDDLCGYIKATADFKIPIVGTVSYTVELRDCIPSSPLSSQSVGCHDSITGPAEDIVNEALSFVSFLGISVSGKSCYCDWSGCDAKNPCSGYYMLDHCFVIWELVLIGIVLLIAAGLILSGCCCCCCCMCCKSRTPGTVHSNQPNVIIVPQQQQPGGYVNAGYAPAPQPYAGAQGAPPQYPGNAASPPAKA